MTYTWHRSQVKLSITMLFHYAECLCAKCCVLFIIMLIAVLLKAIMLSVLAPSIQSLLLPLQHNICGEKVKKFQKILQSCKKVSFKIIFLLSDKCIAYRHFHWLLSITLEDPFLEYKMQNWIILKIHATKFSNEKVRKNYIILKCIK